MGKGKKKKPSDNTIAQNKRARFDYHLLENFEAGVSLMGWEVKALRAGRIQLTDSFVLMTNGEAFLHGAKVSPLDTVSTHYVTEPARTRKLLLHKKELAKINAGISQKGQTCVCTSLTRLYKLQTLRSSIRIMPRWAKGRRKNRRITP